ncbi:hypothetical protein OA57_11695 [Chelonobacter oris]|uniref:Uncharacterized protein n=1 Tax=Chelonobacter oris TaxID=505317 RepID=A0A0A3AJ54_9PAST|nr:hypothetical protein OA57_11695 [Chelonobacter oris]
MSAEIGKRAVENNWIAYMLENPGGGANEMSLSSLAKEKEDEAKKYGQDMAIPHYVSAEAGIYKYGAKILVNTRTGDIFVSNSISSISFSSGVSIGAEVGWISGIRISEAGNNLGGTINSVLSGPSFSSKGCYGVYCIGVGSTPPISKFSNTKQTFGVGLGGGFSIGGEYSSQITGER